MSEGFRGWAILEIMGHRQVAGYVTDVELFGAKMARIDIPEIPASAASESENGFRYPALPGVPAFTQYYGGSSVFCMTPTTEAVARAAAVRLRQAPPANFDPTPSARQLPGVEDDIEDAELVGRDEAEEAEAAAEDVS
jgi:hypothetical protein